MSNTALLDNAPKLIELEIQGQLTLDRDHGRYISYKQEREGMVLKVRRMTKFSQKQHV